MDYPCSHHPRLQPFFIFSILYFNLFLKSRCIYLCFPQLLYTCVVYVNGGNYSSIYANINPPSFIFILSYRPSLFLYNYMWFMNRASDIVGDSIHRVERDIYKCNIMENQNNLIINCMWSTYTIYIYVYNCSFYNFLFIFISFRFSNFTLQIFFLFISKLTFIVFLWLSQCYVQQIN